MVDVKYYASVSWGKDSTAMLLKLIEENKPLDEVVFYDTGMEFDCIYKVRDKVLPLLEKRNIKYTELHPPIPFWVDMLIKPKTKRKTKEVVYGNDWCGQIRWQTFIKQKICNQYTGTENKVYIGIAYDEPKRFEKLDDYKIAPLVEYQMTEQDCLAYCKSKGIEWIEDGVNLYEILDRVSCWNCANKNLKELRNIYQYLPRYWGYLKGLQERIDRPFRRDEKTIFDLEERFKRELNENE